MYSFHAFSRTQSRWFKLEQIHSEIKQLRLETLEHLEHISVLLLAIINNVPYHGLGQARALAGHEPWPLRGAREHPLEIPAGKLSVPLDSPHRQVTNSGLGFSFCGAPTPQNRGGG